MLIINPLRFVVTAAVLATSPVHALVKTIEIKASATATVRANARLTTSETYEDTRVTHGSSGLSLVKTLSNTSYSGQSLKASAATSVFIESKYNKSTARVKTNAFLENSFSPLSQQATSNGLVESLSIDRITFTNLKPGFDRELNFKDLIYYKRLPALSTTGQAPSILTSNNFQYSTEIIVFDNLVDSQSLVYPKYNSTFIRCNNIFVCGADNIINSIYTFDHKSIYVGADDVMFIINRLSIWTESTLSIAPGNLAPGSATFASQLLPQFVGERTMKFANGTPVVSNLFGSSGFVADSGSSYLSTSVPEPASWAMLIAGFGLTGAAMRQRRQGQRAVAA